MENNTSPVNSCNFERASTSLKQFGIFKLDQLTDSTANTNKLTKFYSFSEFQGLGHLYKFGFAGDAAKFLMS